MFHHVFEIVTGMVGEITRIVVDTHRLAGRVTIQTVNAIGRRLHETEHVIKITVFHHQAYKVLDRHGHSALPKALYVNTDILGR